MPRTPLRKSFSIVRKDDAKRVVYGWASVSSVRKSNGTFEPYIDLQGDWMTDETMEEMAHDYCTNSRATKCMHQGSEIGHCVASMPLTEEIMKVFGIECDRAGWLVAMRITDPLTWAKVASNAFSGFSIGGFAEFEE
jgi:hypothetical protein